MANSKAMGPVKVVLIEYHHIQTDVSNFKSVVQSLTGQHSGGGDTRKRRRVDESIVNYRAGRFEESSETYCRTAATSFKDLDRLLKLELPSMEDLNWIWAD